MIEEEARPGRPWRGRSPAQRRADRRRRLLDAALQLFGTDGYAATSTAALCAAAGVSTKHLYEVFADREAVLLALYEELLAELTARTEAALTGTALTAADDADPVTAGITAGVAAVVDYQLTDPRRARVLQLEVLGVSPAVEARRHAAIRAFADLIVVQRQQLVDAGHLPARPFDLLATALVGAVDELVVSCLVADAPPDPAEVQRTLEELFTSVMAAPGR